MSIILYKLKLIYIRWVYSDFNLLEYGRHSD